MSSIVHRLGTFVLVLATGVLFLFVLSELARLPDFDLLFLSMFLYAGAWLLRRRRPAAAPSGRFALLRRARRRKPVPNTDDEHEESPH